jgi:hypothetical protein
LFFCPLLTVCFCGSPWGNFIGVCEPNKPGN